MKSGGLFAPRSECVLLIVPRSVAKLLDAGSARTAPSQSADFVVLAFLSQAIATADTRSVPHSRHSIRLTQSGHPAHSRVCSNVIGAIFATLRGTKSNRESST